ncbi:SLC2A3, partial [Symbiodinium pilosum]
EVPVPEPADLELLKELVGPTGAWRSWSSQLHHHDPGLAHALGAFIQYQKPKKVIDMGCGSGFYVRAMRARGIDCDGFDGHQDTESLTDGLCYHADFADVELPKKICLEGYDWCICLEVFEHVPKHLEDQLVDCLLAGAGKGLVLSVATPGQGGLGHVNEQPHEYVISRLEERGLILDANSHLRLRQYCQLPWFRENLLVFRRPAEKSSASPA